MSFNTIRDLSVPPANFLKDEDLLAIADFDSAITYKISVHELMQLQQVFSQDTKGLVPGPSESEKINEEILVSDSTWRPISYFANNKTDHGVVSAPGSNAHAVWMTDASGNPGWRSHRTFGTEHTGLVPAPSDTDVAAEEWLNADGTWRPLPATPIATADTAGLVKSGGDITVSADGTMTIENLPPDLDSGFTNTFTSVSVAPPMRTASRGTFSNGVGGISSPPIVGRDGYFEVDWWSVPELYGARAVWFKAFLNECHLYWYNPYTMSEMYICGVGDNQNAWKYATVHCGLPGMHGYFNADVGLRGLTWGADGVSSSQAIGAGKSRFRIIQAPGDDKAYDMRGLVALGIWK